MIEPIEKPEPDETEYRAWQDQQAANGNSLHSLVRLKFRSGTSMRRARDIWDVMVRQYESAAIVKDGRRLFLTIKPPKDDCRYVWMMLFCKDIVGIETNATDHFQSRSEAEDL